MTRYTVVWPREVEADLAQIWLGSDDREAVAKAANEIDRTLSVDAIERGGDVGEGLRFYVAPPLRALYTVREKDRIVEVLRVRLL